MVERDISTLHRKLSAMLASNAYSAKEEHAQIIRLNCEFAKGDEINIVRRAWAIRRVMAAKLMKELELELDRLEAKYAKKS